ncbi:uncharacterized protein [Triticum aestivum]|uniref:uncharacterized protein n=1 Tax=Triticum aestivum TaxID=4565 RepID=UPI001D001A71|nr:uncharacterized protein LOC123046662 [Triticum aestivum]
MLTSHHSASSPMGLRRRVHAVHHRHPRPFNVAAMDEPHSSAMVRASTQTLEPAGGAARSRTIPPTAAAPPSRRPAPPRPHALLPPAPVQEKWWIKAQVMSLRAAATTVSSIALKHREGLTCYRWITAGNLTYCVSSSATLAKV